MPNTVKNNPKQYIIHVSKIRFSRYQIMHFYLRKSKEEHDALVAALNEDEAKLEQVHKTTVFLTGA